VEKFDEFLIRCNALSTEGQSQILSRFRVGLREDLQTKLLAREITELKKAYALVQDLDAAKSSFVLRVTHKQLGSNRVHTSTAFKVKLLPTRQILIARVSRTKAKALTESSLSWLPQSNIISARDMGMCSCQLPNSGQNCLHQWEAWSSIRIRISAIYFFEEKKSLIWTMIPQVIALVLIAFYPSSGVPYFNPRRKMIGDEPSCFILLWKWW